MLFFLTTKTHGLRQKKQTHRLDYIFLDKIDIPAILGLRIPVVQKQNDPKDIPLLQLARVSSPTSGLLNKWRCGVGRCRALNLQLLSSTKNRERSFINKQQICGGEGRAHLFGDGGDVGVTAAGFGTAEGEGGGSGDVPTN